jgi:hypothetical protein
MALGFDDTTRATLAIKDIADKKLTYQRPHGAASWPMASA